MTDAEILRQKLNLEDSLLDEKGKEEFLTKTDNFHDIFRNKIGTCPFIEVHLRLKDETPFFVQPYPMREEQRKVIQKEMDRLEYLGIIQKGLTGYCQVFDSYVCSSNYALLTIAKLPNNELTSIHTLSLPPLHL